jgi:hypothetical protein
MPIRKELRHLYTGPAWEQARSEALELAGYRCAHCKIPNGILAGRFANRPGVGYAFKRKTFYTAHCRPKRHSGSPPVCDRLIRIVLTVAHLDRDPEKRNLDQSNLRPLCQSCHLAYDRKANLSRARLTRTTFKDSRRPLLTNGDPQPMKPSKNPRPNQCWCCHDSIVPGRVSCASCDNENCWCCNRCSEHCVCTIAQIVRMADDCDRNGRTGQAKLLRAHAAAKRTARQNACNNPEEQRKREGDLR